jgi:hypothetical protein
MKRSDPTDALSIEQGLSILAERLAKSGLALRGAFDFGSEETSPLLNSGEPSKSVVLIGNIGGAFWPHFKRWRDDQPPDLKNPLDSWSRQVTEEAAIGLQAQFASPSDRPFMPFQQWAMRAERLHPSPLGILMHPEWGLWHAYRGALLFERRLGFAAPDDAAHLCDECTEKPRLRACPVEAYSASEFEHRRCLEHVRGPTGQACRWQGCLDRNACPYGAEHRYPAEMQAFLMRAYARL